MDSHDRHAVRLLGWIAGVGIGLLHIVYILSPIDLIPDVIPVIGWLDDLVALGSASLLTAVGAFQLWRHWPAPDPIEPPVYEPLSAEEIHAL